MVSYSLSEMRSPLIKEMTGMRFGRATVLRFDCVKNYNAKWIIECDCGTIKSVEGRSLRSGNTSSCGCLNYDLIKAEGLKCKTHGLTNSPTYYSWTGMNQRCSNPNHSSWKNYGGRGIKVCKRWRHSFKNFLSDMGERPSLDYSIERSDNDGNYEPSNCKWADLEEQHNNTRTNVKIEWRGVTMTITQWSRKLGIKTATLFSRLGKGWSIQDALQRKVAA